MATFLDYFSPQQAGWQYDKPQTQSKWSRLSESLTAPDPSLAYAGGGGLAGALSQGLKTFGAIKGGREEAEQQEQYKQRLAEAVAAGNLEKGDYGAFGKDVMEIDPQLAIQAMKSGTEMGAAEEQAQRDRELEAQKAQMEAQQAAQDRAMTQAELGIKREELKYKNPAMKKYLEGVGTAAGEQASLESQARANLPQAQQKVQEILGTEEKPGLLDKAMLDNWFQRQMGSGVISDEAAKARTAIQQELSSNTLVQLGKLKGALSDKEREFIENIEGGGDITNYTRAEIEQYIDSIMKKGRRSLKESKGRKEDLFRQAGIGSPEAEPTSGASRSVEDYEKEFLG